MYYYNSKRVCNFQLFVKFWMTHHQGVFYNNQSNSEPLDRFSECTAVTISQFFNDWTHSQSVQLSLSVNFWTTGRILRVNSFHTRSMFERLDAPSECITVIICQWRTLTAYHFDRNSLLQWRTLRVYHGNNLSMTHPDCISLRPQLTASLTHPQSVSL